jgi:hypothetical protein
LPWRRLSYLLNPFIVTVSVEVHGWREDQRI